MSSRKADGDAQEYSCDLPGCYVSREGRTWREARFVRLDSPEIGSMPRGKRDFCSARCLLAFAQLLDPSLSPRPAPVPGSSPPPWELEPVVDLDAEPPPEEVAELNRLAREEDAARGREFGPADEIAAANRDFSGRRASFES